MKMIHNLSIRIKLFIIGGLAVLMTAVVGGFGYWGITQVDGAMDEISTNSAALRNHLEADMMHDALRGDVLAALLWSQRRDAQDRSVIEEDLTDHIALFRTALVENESLSLNDKIMEVIEETLPALDQYISSAESIVAMAFINPRGAQNRFGDFTDAFAELEDKMAALSDLIENSSNDAQSSGDQVVVLAKNIILGAAVSSLAIMAALIFFITGLIVKPINLMVKGIERLAANDLTVTVDVQAKDETGIMASAFNEATGKLRDVLVKIMASSGQVEAASAQISSATEQLAAGAEEQQAQLSEVATTMEEMSAMILEASKNADETRENAQSTGVTAEKGRELVSKTVSGFETVANTVKEAAGQIQELNRRSEEIGNVIQVIEDIADQTNLLALNANIEAARAGDAGRGFAVVADEVRKLAERTVSATAEISTMIGTIQEGIGKAVVSMDVIQTQSTDGLDLVAKSDASLEEISGSITTVVAAVEQIATASGEQSSGAEEISKNIEGVSTVAKESANSAQLLAASAEQLNGEVANLNKIVSQFRLE